MLGQLHFGQRSAFLLINKHVSLILLSYEFAILFIGQLYHGVFVFFFAFTF